jgi:hypothetical protein
MNLDIHNIAKIEVGQVRQVEETYWRTVRFTSESGEVLAVDVNTEDKELLKLKRAGAWNLTGFVHKK